MSKGNHTVVWPKNKGFYPECYGSGWGPPDITDTGKYRCPQCCSEKTRVAKVRISDEENKPHVHIDVICVEHEHRSTIIITSAKDKFKNEYITFAKVSYE